MPHDFNQLDSLALAVHGPHARKPEEGWDLEQLLWQAGEHRRQIENAHNRLDLLEAPRVFTVAGRIQALAESQGYAIDLLRAGLRRIAAGTDGVNTAAQVQATLTLQQVASLPDYPQTEQRPEEGPDVATEGRKDRHAHRGADSVAGKITEARTHVVESRAASDYVNADEAIRLGLEQLTYAVELLSQRRVAEDPAEDWGAGPAGLVAGRRLF